jgi:hypothetical protein
VTENKHDEDKIADITDEKELTEEEMKGVDGGLFVARTFASKDDCDGKCAGTIKSATGSQLEI